MLIIQCISCRQGFQTNPELAGHSVTCSGCQQPIQKLAFFAGAKARIEREKAQQE